MAAIAVTIGVVGTAGPAGAEDLVSNLSFGTDTPLEQQRLSTNVFAQSFTTGSNASGYCIGSITLDFAVGRASSTDPVYVYLHKDDGNGRPDHPQGGQIATFTKNGYSFEGPVTGLNKYTVRTAPRAENPWCTPSPTVHLDASTRYWVYVWAGNDTTTAQIDTTIDTRQTGNDGWSIADTSLTRPEDSAYSEYYGYRGKLRMKVEGTTAPEVEITISDASATEGVDLTADFTVSLSRAAYGKVTVDYSALAIGTAFTNDFEVGTGSLTFQPGETRKTISIPVYDDPTGSEADETFIVRLLRPTGATMASRFIDATGTIVNSSALLIDLAAATGTEASGKIDFRLFLNRATNRPTVISYSVNYNAGASPADLVQETTTGTATIEAGETETTISIGIVDDTVSDNNEQFRLEIQKAQGTLGALHRSYRTGTILNTERLDASFKNAASVHDGTQAFTLDVHFTRDVSMTASAMRDDAFTVTNGDVTAAAQIDSRKDRWRITVTPDSASTITISLPGNRDCSTPGAICSDEENPVQLGNSPSATVTHGTPLMASFSNLPAENPETNFTFDLAFTHELKAGWRQIQNALSVTGGSVKRVWRTTKGSDLSWYVKVQPSGSGQLTITLSAPVSCVSSDAICTNDGRRLSNAPSATVTAAAGAETTPTASIADGSGTEGTDSVIGFTVTLDEAAAETVTVDYATSDGTAEAGDDYTAKSGTLSFDAGTTSKTISVSIADDTDDESDETFTVTLSNASGADLGTATATGTIRNRTVVVKTTPTVSIAGGSGKEGDDDEIDFTVTLDEAASGTVTVSYATSDGTADAGDDYTAKSGTLSFSAGTTSKTLSVGIEDDIENESDETFTVTLSNPSGADLGTATATGTIQNRRVEPLTARFEGMPSEHDGGEFTFELHFSENVKAGYKRLRDHAFTLSGDANVKQAQRKTQGSNQSWTIRVNPNGNERITITLPETTNCSSSRAICTDDERKLSHSTSDSVTGPVGISVGDIEVAEGADAVLVFAVALTRAASSALTVDYATSDGTATAGSDYTSASGTLTIGAGSSSGTIEVSVIDDEHNEGSETFTLTLSNPSSGNLTDSSATGTITNHDALPAALMARFGRTAALHVVEMVEERVDAPRAPGFDGRVAGQRIHRDMGQDFALNFLQQLGGGYAGPGTGMPSANGGMTSSLGPQGHISPQGMQGTGMQNAGVPSGGLQGMGIESTSLQGPTGYSGGLHPDAGFGFGMGGRDQVLQGSGFALNRATKTGGVLSFWSRSAQSSFYGQDGALALNGDVRSTMVGADYSKGRMVTGVSLSHSRGLGGYAGGADTGRMTSAVTGLYPWVGFKASERVTVWTVAGYGAGGLLLDPGAGAPIETGLSMAMAAGGGRGELMTSEAGFELAFKADALWVGTRTDAASGASGNLRATRAGVTRLRTALEGSKSTTIAARMAFTPSVEVGIRQDGGDAEVGRGLDVGLGLVLADGVTGLAVDVRVRRLLVHQADGFEENGVSVSVSYDPTPKTPLGFTARVSPAWGGDAMSGAETLWGRESMGGMGQDRLLGGGGNRLDTELGYGLPIGARFVGTPRVGLRTSEYGRDYRVGYGMQVLEQGKLNLELGIDAERRESPVFHLQEGSAGTDQRVLGRATVQW